MKTATIEQIREHQKHGGIYPLAGYVTIDGHVCEVEGLPPNPDNIKYEILAPEGMEFMPDGITSRLCWSLSEVHMYRATLAPIMIGGTIGTTNPDGTVNLIIDPLA